MEHPPPPLRTGRFPVGKTTAQRTGLKIKLKKILTVTFHEGHYVLDFNQGQKAPSKLNTSKLSKENKPLRVDLYLRTTFLMDYIIVNSKKRNTHPFP